MSSNHQQVFSHDNIIVNSYTIYLQVVASYFIDNSPDKLPTKNLLNLTL